jgi:hypothetical protein
VTRLDAMLQPGEDVVWRHDPEFSMGPKWPYVMGPGILLAMLAILGGVVLWNVAVPPRILLLAGLIFLMPVLFCAAPLLSGMWSRAIAVTAGRMVWRSGPAGLGTIATIDRAEIAAATIYEGSNVLVLHGRDGRTIRLTGVEEAEPLARALAVPGRIWRKGKDAQVSVESLWTRVAGALVGVAPVDFLIHRLVTDGQDVRDGYGMLVLLVTVGLAIVLMVVHTWGEIAGARKLSPADRKTTACRRLNPLCRGVEPPRLSLVTILALPFIAFDRRVIRMAYGGPYDCDCPPEEFGPGTTRGGGRRT